jgi:uncharacterized membrane protein
MAASGGRGPSERLRVALVVGLCCLTILVGWWSKARCLDAEGWTEGEQYRGWCYTDVYALWWAEGLDRRALPYLDHPVEYPVLTGAQMGVAALVVYALPGVREAEAFFHVTALMGAGFLLGTLALLVRTGVPPVRLLWFAVAPTLAAYAFMNWDPLAVFAATAAVLAHLRGRDALSGVAAGLGTAAKLFPVFLVPIVVGARLAQGRARDALAHGGAAALTWLAVNLPVIVLAPAGWRRFLELNQGRPADWDSLWLLAASVGLVRLDVAQLNRASLVLFLAGVGVIVAIGARRRPARAWWTLLLPVLCWFLLTNKVYSPQFSLWLLPLFALTLPRAAPVAAFAVADLMVFVTRFAYLGGRQGFTPAPGYEVFAWAVAIRACVLVWIIAVCVLWLPDWLEHRAAAAERAVAADPFAALRG